ncbi:thiamine pyrophosphate-dependent enzyme [Thalassotalea piscium]|uniref:3-methyl-2-oxobutanoate dehydrogenase (2-methylpropanoyl-transferring) n=1 Tax=Thalassotalea piscium TaxID=1230533 RepID=A0A7X0TS05_9GAMM|nr:thiamine pyrophosphate-dependent enzyme [Thalassotalea piscium]MBB6541637.1 2-oxoisovalerate dehydrogenase E1 component [Thalassotalea piscium]
MSDRNQLLKDAFISKVLAGDLPTLSQHQPPKSVGLTHADLIDLFETQVISRHLDLHSRVMQKQGQSFYTIGSSGHEGNAACAKAFRLDDMAFLHYRSGAFVIQRSKKAPGQTPIYDMLLSFSASKDDPISGGRHKVLGSKSLFIPPQTSTIASHLPKAMGAAFSIDLAKRLAFEGELANDSIIVCSFGDASQNHSTAQGAINSAAWASYQSIPMPIVFVCEDNGIGISTSTPKGWVEANYKNRAGLVYLTCDGLNLIDTYQTTLKAAHIARTKRCPVFLHIKLIRLLGHAGSDAEFVYRKQSEIDKIEQQDPLLHSAAILLEHNILDAKKIVDIYQKTAQRIENIAERVITKPKLTTSEEVMASLLPAGIEAGMSKNSNNLTQEKRLSYFAHEKHNLSKKQHLAKLINWTLMDLMAEHNDIVMLGEDIARKGGVYNVTAKLHERFGQNRVLNTLLDEQSILGGAIGLAHNGFIPIPEIQFLAYVHNAEDQIRGEAATLSFFSNQQFTNPMVIRIAGLAYQKGFGGHFHNDNSFAVFRDIPGIVLACPSNGKDAVEMLRASVRLAKEQQKVVVFLEPIALYMAKDLHEEGDGLWTFAYPEPEHDAPPVNMQVSTYGKGKEVCILTYGNGYFLSRQAEKILADKHIHCRVVDLRWLAPLDQQGIIDEVSQCQQVLIVDECRKTGSISEALMALLIEAKLSSKPIERICAQDSFIPLGSAAYEVLPSCQDIVDKVSQMIESNGNNNQTSITNNKGGK